MGGQLATDCTAGKGHGRWANAGWRSGFFGSCSASHPDRKRQARTGWFLPSFCTPLAAPVCLPVEMAGVDSLLSSFPAPPTFIPASPLPYDRDSYNLDEEDERDEFPFPGLMGPPRVPLPALPGGANELDALMSICNSPAPSRRTSVASWRFSRLSDTTVFVKSDHMAPLQPRSSISLPDESSPPTPTAPRPPRSASPDVAELLATTPRPLVRRLNTLSLTSSASTSSTSSLINQDDDYSSSQSDGEHSDSSIDIATPLPNLMVRAGLLSPHSKILIPPGALPAPKVRGAPKDARDTQRRRNRHRDGRLLREGVGLTTGLGWSDR